MIKIVRYMALVIAAYFVVDLWGAQAHANCFTLSNNPDSGACQNSKIRNIYLHPSGDVFIYLDDDVEDLPCTPYGGGGIRLSKNLSIFKESYALLLTAFYSNQTVTIAINQNNASCYLYYLRSSSVPE